MLNAYCEAVHEGFQPPSGWEGLAYWRAIDGGGDKAVRDRYKRKRFGLFWRACVSTPNE